MATTVIPLRGIVRPALMGVFIFFFVSVAMRTIAQTEHFADLFPANNIKWDFQ